MIPLTPLQWSFFCRFWDFWPYYNLMFFSNLKICRSSFRAVFFVSSIFSFFCNCAYLPILFFCLILHTHFENIYFWAFLILLISAFFLFHFLLFQNILQFFLLSFLWDIFCCYFFLFIFAFRFFLPLFFYKLKKRQLNDNC